jgi:hypothetical protein
MNAPAKAYPGIDADRESMLRELRCEALHFRVLAARVDWLGFDLANGMISPATARLELAELYGMDPEVTEAAE